MVDTAQGTSADLPGDLSYGSIDAAFAAANVAYGMVGNSISATVDGIGAQAYQQLIGAGWVQLPSLFGEDDPTTHYQGVAFYKVVNGVTEVIIANRGTQSGGDNQDTNYDLTKSDASLGLGLEPPCNNSAMTYYNAVTQWLQVHIQGPVQIIERGHSLGGEEADDVEAKLTLNPQSNMYAAETEAVGFDAPGLPDQDKVTGANALNVSLSTDPVHTIGAIGNAGFGGSSVTLNGGISLFWDYVSLLNPMPGGFMDAVKQLFYDGVTGPDADHSRTALAATLSTMPAVGNVNLFTYQAGSITQTEVS